MFITTNRRFISNLRTPYHYKGLEGETTAELAKAVTAEIGGGGHVHPDSDEELQAAVPLPTRGKRTRETQRYEVKFKLESIKNLTFGKNFQARQPPADPTRTPERPGVQPPHKIPRKLNSQVWAKDIRPEELQDDDIFDELDR